MTKFLPYGRQDVSDADIAAVKSVLRSDWLTSGPEIETFEDALRDATGASHVVACSSGTAALHLALAALDLDAGDACVVPSITFAATANAVRYCGGRVVFADVDPVTGLMTPETLDEAVTRAGGRVRAALPVHLAGQPADIAGMKAALPSIALIEDASHAIGSVNDGERGGECRHSAAATFSFHPVKTITAGEGGAVALDDTDTADRLRRLRSHGIRRSVDPKGGEARPWHYAQEELGWNYRLTDIQAALGRSQLSRLPGFLARRKEIVERYDKAFTGVSPVVRPLSRRPGTQPGWHLYILLIDFDALGLERGAVMEALAKRGIGTQVHYIPVYHHPDYRGAVGQNLPGAEAYYRHCLSIPLFPAMTDADCDRVIDTLSSELGLQS